MKNTVAQLFPVQDDPAGLAVKSLFGMCDDRTVHLHPSAADDISQFAAGGNSQIGQQLVQSLDSHGALPSHEKSRTKSKAL